MEETKVETGQEEISDNQASEETNESEKETVEDATTEDTQENLGEKEETPWHEGVSEDYVGKIEKFKDIDSLAKSYALLEKKLSQGKKTELPETDEEKEALLKVLGKPENASDYDLVPISPEGQPMTDDYGKVAHEAGLTSDQAKGLYDWYIGQVKGMEQDRVNQNEKTATELKEVWREGYKENVEIAKRGLRNVLNTEIIDKLDQYGFLSDKTFIQAFYNVGKKFANDQIEDYSSKSGVNRTDSGTPMLDFSKSMG